MALVNASEMAEIRIDLCGFDIADTAYVFSHAVNPCIATCRPELVSDDKRVKLLKTAIENGATYVDVELEATEEVKHELIAFAKQYGCKVIVSHHDYEKTPTFDKLQDIVSECYLAGADIAKIAVTAQSVQDSARVLSLYDTVEKPLVALAMGEAGKITRIANVMLGSPFTFVAAKNDTATAPGQLTVDKMKQILILFSE